MAHTNSTENYGLPQWIGTDKPTFLGDFNTAFGVIDGALKDNADAATSAVATANSASAVASSANTNATTALSTANEAKADATSAVTTANTANNKATQAQTDAANALHASAGNSIENLAPAYDPTLTYNVGDLVTYIDAQNSGKMYKCIVAVNTPMEFNINYWDDVTTSEVYAQISGGTSIENVVDMISLYTEPTQVSGHAYAIGDYFVYDSKLYKATQIIAIGGTITPNTNCVATNVTTELLTAEDLSGDIEQLKSDMTTAQNDIDILESKVTLRKVVATTKTTFKTALADFNGVISHLSLEEKMKSFIRITGAGNNSGIYRCVRADSDNLYFSMSMVFYSANNVPVLISRTFNFDTSWHGLGLYLDVNNSPSGVNYTVSDLGNEAPPQSCVIEFYY